MLQELTMRRGNQNFVYRWDEGEEETVLKCLFVQSEAGTINAADASLLAQRIGEMMHDNILRRWLQAMRADGVLFEVDERGHLVVQGSCEQMTGDVLDFCRKHKNRLIELVKRAAHEMKG